MSDGKVTKIAVVGIKGLPPNYGGFETFADNLVELPYRFFVFSDIDSDSEVNTHKNAKILRIPISANGVSSVIYDGISFLQSVRLNVDTILVLGVSGGIFLPLIRIFTKIKIIVNVDGLESRRKKWSLLARIFLSISERIAICVSHRIVVDNRELLSHLGEQARHKSSVIAYGGDHICNTAPSYSDRETFRNLASLTADDEYYLAISRIEPENNVDLILQAHTDSQTESKLVYIGNWNASDYGKSLRQRYGQQSSFIVGRPDLQQRAIGRR